MSKEKNSKFTECYNELRSNENLREELSKLSGSNFKAKLSEVFPSIEVTGHFVRTAKELLKDSSETNSDMSTSEQNTSDKADTFKEIAFDKEDDSTKNNNDTSKEDNITGAITDNNEIERAKAFNDVNYNLSLTSNNTLNKVNSVVTDKNNIKTIDEMSIKINTLKKEIEIKNSDIEVLKSQLDSAYEKIKYLSMNNEEKKKEILEIQTKFPSSSDKDEFKITFHSTTMYKLKSAYADSNAFDVKDIFASSTNEEDYCVKRAVAEAIYTYGTKK